MPPPPRELDESGSMLPRNGVLSVSWRGSSASMARESQRDRVSNNETKQQKHIQTEWQTLDFKGVKRTIISLNHPIVQDRFVVVGFILGIVRR